MEVIIVSVSVLLVGGWIGGVGTSLGELGLALALAMGLGMGSEIESGARPGGTTLLGGLVLVLVPVMPASGRADAPKGRVAEDPKVDLGLSRWDSGGVGVKDFIAPAHASFSDCCNIGACVGTGSRGSKLALGRAFGLGLGKESGD